MHHQRLRSLLDEIEQHFSKPRTNYRGFRNDGTYQTYFPSVMSEGGSVFNPC